MAYGWHYQGMSAGSWALMSIGMLVFGAILIAGLVVLLRHNRLGDVAAPIPTAGDNAIQILKERLAHGELTEEDYSRRLAILKVRS